MTTPFGFNTAAMVFMLMLGSVKSIPRGEAFALTFGAMILVFGIYLIVGPSPEGDEFRPYKYYDWLGTQAAVQPNSIMSHSFEAREGELIEVRVLLMATFGDPFPERFEHSFAVSLTDPTGAVLMDHKDTSEAYGVIAIKQTGKHEIKIVNSGDYLYNISVGVYIVEKTLPLWGNVGLMLVSMSLPAFVLAAWLFLARRP
jgi:hypothetical protein